MSAKRSFDVRPSARGKAKKAPSVRRRTPVSRKPLKARRQEKQRHTVLIFLIVCAVVIGGFIFLLWRPEIRISKVEASGAADPTSLQAIAAKEMEGTYWNVFPRDSFFLYPERTIRAAVLEAHPNVSAVSVSRTGFDSISLKASERVAAFWWCGTPPEAGTDNCFEADAEGYVFAHAEAIIGSTTPMLIVHAALDGAPPESYPLRGMVVGAGRVPDILRFVRAVESLGIPVESIAIREDEADLRAPHGTRITYVIGNEEEAAKGASAAFPSLNLMDGSLDYVDLRFDGKVYLKRRAEVPE